MKWAWLIFTLTVIVSLPILNPHLFQAERGDSRKQFLQKPLIPVPQFFKNAEFNEDHPVISIYRSDLQRTGVVTTSDLHPMSRPLWRVPDFNTENHGASKSSPITDGNAFYLGSDRGGFVRVNSGGKVDWRVGTTATKGIHGSGLIVDKAIYWGDYDGILYSANKVDGKLNWLIDLGDTIGASPLYYQGSIVVSVETFDRANGFIARIDAKNGKVLWLSEYFGSHPHSSPSLSEDGSTVYVGANSNFLFAIDFKTGATHWKFQVDGPIKGTPAIWDGDIYFGSWDGYLYRIDKNGKQVWRSSVDEKCQSSPTFSKKLDRVFISSNAGKTFAFDIKDGKKVWEHTGSGEFMSSPVLLIDSKTKKEVLYANCFANSLCQFNPESGAVLRQFRFESRLSSVPLLVNGQLFTSTDGKGGFIKWY
jgi:outer membrane protein assembly factor BamB